MELELKENLVVFYAIKNFIKKDFCSERINLVDDYLDNHQFIKKCYHLLEKLSHNWLILFAVISSRPTSIYTFKNRICIWKNTNELTSFCKYKFFDRFAKVNYSTVSIQSLVDFILNFYLFILNYKKITNIARLIHKKEIPFYVKLRVSQMLFDYLGYMKILSKFSNRYEIVISTDGQPFAYALFALFKRKICNLHYVAHAYFVNNPQKISVDHFYTLNDLLVESFCKKNSEINKVIDISAHKKKLKNVEKYSFLIGLSKSFDNNYVYELLNKIENLGKEIFVIIRYHPTSLFPNKLIKEDFKNLVFLTSNDQADDFGRTNITICGASNILFDSILAGNYTFYEKNLDKKVNDEITFVNYFPSIDFNNIEFSLEVAKKCELKNKRWISSTSY